MKTTVLTFAAALIASTAAFANDDLFDVNDAPANYEARAAQLFDYEPTAASFAPAYDQATSNYDPTENDKLFD
jgi:hypothetical protein